MGFRVSTKRAVNLGERKLVVRWGLGGQPATRRKFARCATFLQTLNNFSPRIPGCPCSLKNDGVRTLITTCAGLTTAARWSGSTNPACSSSWFSAPAAPKFTLVGDKLVAREVEIHTQKEATTNAVREAARHEIESRFSFTTHSLPAYQQLIRDVMA